MLEIIKIKLFFLALFFAGLTSCEKDKLPPVLTPKEEVPSDSLDTPENCGCGDKDSIAEWSGTIRYKVAPHPSDTSSHNKFWITTESSGIYFHYIVCNEILPSDILRLKENIDTTTRFNVIYSGNRKKTCKIPGTSFGLDALYHNIVLTKIEIQ